MYAIHMYVYEWAFLCLHVCTCESMQVFLCLHNYLNMWTKNVFSKVMHLFKNFNTCQEGKISKSLTSQLTRRKTAFACERHDLSPTSSFSYLYFVFCLTDMFICCCSLMQVPSFHKLVSSKYKKKRNIKINMQTILKVVQNKVIL